MTVFARMDGLSWQTIQRNKAAVRAWHLARNISSAFDGAWDDQAMLFWQGLKRRAVHIVCPRLALSVDQLRAFQQSRLDAATPVGL